MNYTYTISKEADNDAFDKICLEIEKGLKSIGKEELLIDVDGSLIQRYRVENKLIKVFNDYEVDAVYVDSDIDLSDIVN